MDGRSRKMTRDERRALAVDLLAQAALSLAEARRRPPRRHRKRKQNQASEELAGCAEGSVHVREKAGDSRRPLRPRDTEEHP